MQVSAEQEGRHLPPRLFHLLRWGGEAPTPRTPTSSPTTSRKRDEDSHVKIAYCCFAEEPKPINWVILFLPEDLWVVTSHRRVILEGAQTQNVTMFLDIRWWMDTEGQKQAFHWLGRAELGVHALREKTKTKTKQKKENYFNGFHRQIFQEKWQWRPRIIGELTFSMITVCIEILRLNWVLPNGT